MKRLVLLNPGPINVTERVQKALWRGDLCHREEESSRLMGQIRRKLTEAFGINQEYTAVLISGSGTAALEMSISSSLSPGKSILVIQNGVYGERIAKIAEIYQFKKHVLNYPWGQPPRLEDIDKALNDFPDIEVIAMVHHETTTGLLNPLEKVGELAHKYEKRFLADCISSLGGDRIVFDSACPDFIAGTANKCLHGLPGVSFVLFRKKELCWLNKMPARSLYLNLFAHHGAQEAGDMLFTPAIQVHYALDEALDELQEETVQKRIERYKNNASLLRKGFQDIGLAFLVPEGMRSNCLTSLKLPEGISYNWLHDRLKENGFIIYAGQGNFNEKIFRVANMGDIRKEEFEQFLEVLKECFSGGRGELKG